MKRQEVPSRHHVRYPVLGKLAIYEPIDPSHRLTSCRSRFIRLSSPHGALVASTQLVDRVGMGNIHVEYH